MATTEQLLQQARQFHQQGQLQTAVEIYRSAVKSNPRHAGAHTALGQVLSQTGLDAEAVEHLSRAVKLEPTSARALCNLAAVHRGQGRLDEALDCYERAGWMQKRFPRAVAGAAEIYAIRGDYAKAYALLLPYVQVGQDAPPLTLTFARCCRFLDKPNEAASALSKHLSGAPGNLPPMARMNILLELAQAADRLGRAEHAFSAATEGNRVLGRRFPAKDYIQAIDKILTTWTPDAHNALPKAAAESELPVLIVGMPRCGAALVEQILASHPEVGPAGETALSRHIVQRLEGAPAPYIRPFAKLDALNYQIVNEAAGFYTNTLGMISRREGVEQPQRILDRCTHNYLYLGLFDRMLPKARVIHVRRNPLDTALSCYMTALDIPYFFNNHLADFALAYQAYTKLMDHWKSVISMQVLEVNYEDIVADLEGQAKRMVDFLGLAWDPACLEFWKTHRSMVAFNNQGILKPIYTTSAGKHKAYEPYIAPLRAALGMPPADASPITGPAADHT